MRRLMEELWQRGDGCRLRICLECKQAKPLAEFYVRHQYGYPSAQCRVCYRAIARRRYWIKKSVTATQT